MQAKKVNQWGRQGSTQEEIQESGVRAAGPAWCSPSEGADIQGVAVSLYHQEEEGPTGKGTMIDPRCGQMASEVCSRINNQHINNQAKENKKGNYSFWGKDITKMWSLQYTAINNTDIIVQTLNIDINWHLPFTCIGERESPGKADKKGTRAFTLNSGFLFSCSVMSDSLQPHRLQHARLPGPPLSSIVCWRPLSRWCPLTISASFSPPSPALNLPQPQSLFQSVRLFQSVGQSIGVSASVLPMNVQNWFP